MDSERWTSLGVATSVKTGSRLSLVDSPSFRRAAKRVRPVHFNRPGPSCSGAGVCYFRNRKAWMGFRPSQRLLETTRVALSHRWRGVWLSLLSPYVHL